MTAGSSIRWLRVLIVVASLTAGAATSLLFSLPSANGAGTPRLADERTQAELLQAAFGLEAEVGLHAILVRSPLMPCPSSAGPASNKCYSAEQLETFRTVSEDLVGGLLRATGTPPAHPEVADVVFVDHTELPSPFDYPAGSGTIGAASYGIVSASGDRAVMFFHTYGSCLEFTRLDSFVRANDRWLLLASHTPSSLTLPR